MIKFWMGRDRVIDFDNTKSLHLNMQPYFCFLSAELYAKSLGFKDNHQFYNFPSHSSKYSPSELATLTKRYTKGDLEELSKRYYSRERGVEQIFTFTKNTIFAIDFLAMSALMRDTLTCDISECAVYFDVKESELINEQHKFGLLTSDELSSAFKFSSSQQRNYFATRYILSLLGKCENRDHCLYKGYTWKQEWGAINEFILAVSMTEKLSDIKYFFYDSDPRPNLTINDELIEIFRNADLIKTEIKSSMNDGYDIQIIKSSDTDLSIHMLNTNVSGNALIRGIVTLKSQLQDRLKNIFRAQSIQFKTDISFTIDCDDDNIIHISGNQNIINLIFEHLSSSIKNDVKEESLLVLNDTLFAPKDMKLAKEALKNDGVMLPKYMGI